jgi:putative hydrolase of the HAD superfamily
MFPFDVILFDVGGVLLTNGWDHIQRTVVLEQFHLDIDAFEARHARPYDAWERDLVTTREYLDATVFYEPRDFTPDEFFAAICAQSVPLPNGGLGILRELASSGKYMLGCLNNEARETNEYRLQLYGLREVFAVAFSSCYLGLRKPEPAIYGRAIDMLGKPAERILFIDDRQENTAAAMAAGMKAIHFDGAEKLREELEALGVL